MTARAMRQALRAHARVVTSAALISIALWWAALPQPTAEDRASRADAFRFDVRSLPEPPGARAARIRRVHPSLERIAGWISAVGASVALADLDADGFPNELCHVDPRFDEVRLSAADAPDRFASFALRLDALPYDAATMAPMGCMPADLDGNGLIDLLVYFWGRTPILFLRRHAPLGEHAFDARELVQTPQRWFTNAATRADLDGDGRVDLVVANYFPDGARILDAHATGAAEHMQHSMTRAANGGGTHVFLWTGADEWREVAPVWPADVATRWTLALGAADLNGDLLPELYFANDFGPDVLLRNESMPGRLKFTALAGTRDWRTPASKVLGRDSFKGMGVDFADMNGDGAPDLYVSNIAAPYALQESHFLFLSTPRVAGSRSDAAPYVDASEALGLSRSSWAWDAKLDDFNNDGTLEAMQALGFLRGSRSRWPQLQELATGNDQLLSNPRSWPRFSENDDLSGGDTLAFFVRHEDGRYYDIARDIGLARGGVSRGIAIADVNGDGQLDFAVARQWDQSHVFINTAPRPGAFLGLHLLRPLDRDAMFAVRPGHPPRDLNATPAVGATATVWRDGARLGSRQVDGGNGHSGRRSSDLHFGLGAFGQDVEVVVRWRAT